MRGLPASAMPSSTCFCAPWLTSPAIGAAMSCSASCSIICLGLVAEQALGHAPHVKALAAVGDEGGLDVLVHGELGEDVRALERAGDAPCRRSCAAGCRVMLRPSRMHLAAVGLQVPGDEIEQGRLAGAVRADDGGDAALLDAQAHIVGGDKARERLAQACGTRASRRALRRQTARARASMARAPTTPPGKANSRTSRMSPSTNGQYSV